jgi:hypothetical protein
MNPRLLVVSASSLALAALSACNTTPLRIPTLSASVARPANITDGALMVNGANLLANHVYGVGIFTTASPRKIGTVTTDSAGNVNNVKLEYSCGDFSAVLGVELYELDSGGNLGAGIVQTKTDRPECY